MDEMKHQNEKIMVPAGSGDNPYGGGVEAPGPALQIFTDRVEPNQAQWASVEKMLDMMLSAEKESGKVYNSLMDLGDDKLGKPGMRLLNELEESYTTIMEMYQECLQ